MLEKHTEKAISQGNKNIVPNSANHLAYEKGVG